MPQGLFRYDIGYFYVVTPLANMRLIGKAKLQGGREKSSTVPFQLYDVTHAGLFSRIKFPEKRIFDMEVEDYVAGS